ncbi:HNH endonuclease signature motif containing protein [uncultured Ramlibacter sp.]|uniref:HNH endonuclease signature motif containing protein n=1 Tax=uncultured Ramlibacter sp. TaxID=260755 RepID=UPI00261A24A1|nr:HNH endonuclease signature motif containing protein [uncultured Ramlibacter sp.]
MIRSLFAIFLVLASCSAGARIERSQAEVRAFRADNPCPATGRRSGACAGWAVDHVLPLCAGGPDKPANMQWITDADHRFKTLVDERECRKLRRAIIQPAVHRQGDPNLPEQI